MISQREVERRYSKLKVSLAKENRVNCYSCKHPKCGHITKTIDIHEGVTPMFLNCERCGFQAVSSFYNDIAPEQQPTLKWFMPTLQECYKMRKKPELLDHVLRGGLELGKL